MMLQNRVNPRGQLIQTPARGLWMGNRGVVHNDKKQIVRAYNLHAWITCRLAYKNQRLPLMDKGRNTQLFFMDEATALSAGHRPCAFCRREDFNRFKLNWVKGNPDAGYTMKSSIKLLDDSMHEERIDKNGSKITFFANAADLPGSVFILLHDQPHLFYDNQLHPWTPFGYEPPIALPALTALEVLTPASIVRAIAAGYVAQVGTGSFVAEFQIPDS